MSITTVLKKMDRINDLHQQISQKYNGKGRGSLRKSDLEAQQQQDKKIYGYHHQEILQMFKKKQARASSTLCIENSTKIRGNTIHLPRRTAHHGARAQSAAKSVANFRQQYSFLFKEDIFDITHKTHKNSPLPIKTQDPNTEQQMIKSFTHKMMPKKMNKLYSRSIKTAKSNFINSFDDNLTRIQQNNKQPLLKSNNNKIIYQNSHQRNPHQHNEQLFALTIPIQKQTEKVLSKKIQFVSSITHLKEISHLINQTYKDQINLISRVNQNRIGHSIPLFESDFLQTLPDKFTLICLKVDTLESFKLKLQKKVNTIIIQETKQIIDLTFVCQSILGNSSSFLHINIVQQQSYLLLYDQFLLNRNMGHSRNKECQIIFFEYHLKRFLLLDRQVPSIKSLQQSVQLILKNNIDIPDQFLEWTDTLPQKLCNIFDKQNRFYRMQLQDILRNGISLVNQFKKQLGYGHQAVILKHGNNKDEFKRYMFNWQYFYICLLVSSVFMKIIHTIFLLHLNSIQSNTILLNISTTQLTHQFPRNFISFYIFYIHFFLMFLFALYSFYYLELSLLMLSLHLCSNQLSSSDSLLDFVQLHVVFLDEISQIHPYGTIIWVFYDLFSTLFFQTTFFD